MTAGEKNESRHSGTEIYGLSKAETECLLNLFDHRKEFISLIDKSGGTKYECEKERFVKDIEAHLLEHRDDNSTDAPLFILVA